MVINFSYIRPFSYLCCRVMDVSQTRLKQLGAQEFVPLGRVPVSICSTWIVYRLDKSQVPGLYILLVFGDADSCVAVV